MFSSILHVEHIKLYRRALLWIELATIAIAITLTFGGFFAARLTGLFPNDSMDAMMTWPDSLSFSLSFVTGRTFGALLVMLLTSVVVAQEYQWGTYALWLRQGISRSAVLGAKLITMFGAVILITITALVTGGLASALFTAILQGGVDLGRVNLPQVILSLGRTVYSQLPYLTLAFLFAVVTRSTVWSLGAAAAYALVIEGPLTQVLVFVIGGLPAKLAMWLPGSMALSVVDINSTIGVSAGGPPYLRPATAALGIAVYSLIFLAAAFRTFVRQDFTG